MKIEGEQEGENKAEKVTYKIAGSKEKEETEIKTGEKITIEGEGKYIITAYSYGKEGNKSRGRNVEIIVKNHIPELTEENTKITQEPEEWTNKEVKVKIETEIEGYILQYSKDGSTWEDYKKEVEVEENGKIYARLRNEEQRTGKEVEKEITNIDRQEPEKVEIERATQDTNSIEIEAVAEDAEATEKDGKSGIAKYYYSKDGGKAWEPEEGEQEGKYKFENLKHKETYKIVVKAEDKAGNEKVGEIKEVTTGEVPEGKGNIKITKSEENWTNQNIKIELENKAGEKYKIEYSKDGSTWEEYTEETEIEIEENGSIYARLKDKAGNVGIPVEEEITNIDKLLPTVSLAPNGGTRYAMPSTGDAKISTILTAEDPEMTETNGQSGLNILQYAWSESNTEEPTEWKNFTNGSKIEKTDIEEPGTWYLWTKVIDTAGNRASKVKVSNPFIVGSNEDEANKISLTPNETNWTNEDVVVEVKIGENLGQNKKVTCTGTEGVDYEITAEENVIVKTNGVTITVEAEDIAGNKVVASTTITNIDKELPAMNSLMASTTNWTNQNVILTGKAQDSQSGIVAYMFSKEAGLTAESEGWTNITATVEEITQTKEVEENGTWYFYVKDEAGNINKKEIALKIDKIAPTVNTVLNVTGKTSSSINLSIEVTDSLSGISKIEWYYKQVAESNYTKLEDAFTELNGKDAGVTERARAVKEITGLRTGTYSIYAIVYDVAGNAVRSPEAENINISTTEIPTGVGNIILEYTPSTWTNGNVKVRMTKKEEVSSYILQYSLDNITWENYKGEIEMSANGKVYARLMDNVGNVGSIATGNVTKIDKEAPRITIGLKAVETKTTSIAVALKAVDNISGLSKIEWYYKPVSGSEYTKLTDEYTQVNGANAGETEEIAKGRQITGLITGETYNIYAIVYDVAGNQVRSPETGDITVATHVHTDACYAHKHTSACYTVHTHTGSTTEGGGCYTVENTEYDDCGSASRPKDSRCNDSTWQQYNYESSLNTTDNGVAFWYIPCQGQPASSWNENHKVPREAWWYKCSICGAMRVKVKSYCSLHGDVTNNNYFGTSHVVETYCPGHTVYSLGCGKTEGQAYLTCGKTEDLSLICGHD